jgi:hypothetical protein
LIIAAMVAFGLLSGWYYLRHQPDETMARQRRATGRLMTWRCPGGHTFKAPGSYFPVACQECDRRAEMEVVYVCPIHGDLPALIRMDVDEDQRERLSEVSFRVGVWRTIRDENKCPDCGRNLTPKIDKPFGR